MACAKDDPKLESGLKGLYLGQTPPGNTPIVFLPDEKYYPLLSIWWWHSSPIFSPNGKQMLFAKYPSNESGYSIWSTEDIDGHWTEPQKISFIEGIADCPVFVGNDTIYYVKAEKNGDWFDPVGIYRVVRNSNIWGLPVKIEIPIPSGYKMGGRFTISKSKNIYLYLLDANNGCDIFIARYVNGAYQQAEIIPDLNSTAYDGADYIDPDEKFMILSSGRAGGYGQLDIYISRKQADGKWSTPSNLGSIINSSTYDFFSTLSPDGKYLFFISTRIYNGKELQTPYWVDASILNNN